MRFLYLSSHKLSDFRGSIYGHIISDAKLTLTKRHEGKYISWVDEAGSA